MPPLILIAAGILGGAALVRLAWREAKAHQFANSMLLRKAKPAEQERMPKRAAIPTPGLSAGVIQPDAHPSRLAAMAASTSG